MFKFKVTQYEGDGTFETYTGFVPGTTYKEALSNLIGDNFSEHDIVSLQLEFVTENNILYVPEGIADVIKEENDI